MKTIIATIAAILLAFTSEITAISKHDHAETKTELATGFSLLDDAGDHVLHFGAKSHGRRLDSTSKIYLKFKAFGSSFQYNLHRSPSVSVPDTKIYTYGEHDGNYLKIDAPEETRSFSSKANDAALTFLDHDNIMGTLLLHNRTMEFNSNGVDTLLVHTSLHQGVNCGVGPKHSIMLHDGHDENEHTNLRNPDKSPRVAGAGDHEIPSHRRQLLEKWFGSGSCYSRDDVTRRFMIGIGIGRQLVVRRKFTTDQQIFNFVVAIFNQANLIYREQLNLVLTIGAIVVAGGLNKRLDGSGQKVGNVQAPLWDNPNCDDTLDTQLTKLQDWEHVEKFGSWQVLDECFWNRRSGNSIGLATTGSICRPKAYYSNVKGYPNTGVNWYSSSIWKTFAHEVGHNFGARHSFEEGQGRTGGIMDYGDGKLNGEYQFNTQYRKKEVCSTISRVLSSCAHGFQTFQAACGNGLLEDGETCECENKGTSCKFCNGCRLQAGKVCSPDAINAACCTSTGQFADTSVNCKVGEDTGTCGGQKGECLLSPFQNFRLGHVCGIQSSDAPCKLTFKQSADSACNIKYSRTTCNGKYCNAVQAGALCTYNGELRTCIERSSFTEMACKGPLPQGTSKDCVGTWGEWSTCKLSGLCPSTSGKQTRKFTVSVAAVGNGKCEAADGAVESQSCKYSQCPEDCVAKWEDQVKCSATCGDATKTQRLIVTSPARNGGKSCKDIYGAENNGLKKVACPNMKKCPDPAPAVVDCQGGYGGFRACKPNVGDCGAGKKTKTFVVTVKESGGGKPCGDNPPIIQSCRIACNVDCVGKWVLETRCSKLCGPDSVRAKTYKVTTRKENRGKECPHRDGTKSFDDCETKNCPVAAKKGKCDLHTDKTLPGLPDVGGGSPSDEQWDLDKCYSVCMAADACNSFSYTPEFGKCLLWSAVKTKSVSGKDLAQISGTNFYRECKVTFVPSDTCGEHWRNKAFPGAGALAETTGKERKDCNQACDSNKACSAWSFNKVSAKCQLWPREYAANSDSKWVTDPNSDVYLCPTRKKEPQTTTARPTGTTTTTTTTLNPSCDCDGKGERTGRIGCPKPNEKNGLAWCYVSKGCDLVKWLKANNPSFQAGQSPRYDMKWRQCTPKSGPTTVGTDAFCKTIELQRRYKRGNGVCDAVLNKASCQFDGGDCCEKDGAQPNMGLCKDDPYKCVCLDPEVLGKKPTPGCQNDKACNFNKLANTGTDDVFCKLPKLGYDCAGKCIDDDICGGSYLQKRGCCRTDDRRAMSFFKDVAATTEQECTTACNRDKECTGFQWQQSLERNDCRIFYKELPSYGEPACSGGADTQCFINEKPPASVKQKCLTGPGIDKATDSKGQDCSAYETNPGFCGFFDSETFKSKELCCACEEFKCENTNHPSRTDKFGKGCGDYAKDPVKYCEIPSRDSKTLSYTDCCACQTDVLNKLKNPPPKPLDKLADKVGLTTSALAGIITASILGVVIIVVIAVAVAAVKSRMKKKKEEQNGPKSPGSEQTIGEIVQFDGV